MGCPALDQVAIVTRERGWGEASIAASARHTRLRIELLAQYGLQPQRYR